jgi:HAD superfamily hydrolase (TIGR01509 family)
MQNIKAFIFDMDGLIFDTERLNAEAWRCAQEEVGHSLTSELIHGMIGRRVQDSLTLVQSHFGDTASVASLFESQDRHYDRLIREKPIPVKRGIREMLEYLRHEKIPACVATGTVTDRALYKLNSVALVDYFSGVIGADQVIHGKPSPEIFLKAAAVLKMEPQDCVVFEDSGPGIRAAHDAGTVPVLIPDLQEPTAQTRALAKYEFVSMLECLNCLRKSLSRNS